MNKDFLNKKIVDDENIRNHFLNLSFRKKSGIKSARENIVKKNTPLGSFTVIVLLFSLLSVVLKYDIFSLSIVHENKDFILKCFVSFLMIIFTMCAVEIESKFSLNILNLLVIVLFLMDYSSAISSFVNLICLTSMFSPVILKIFDFFRIVFSSMMKPDEEYNDYIEKSDHDILKHFLNKDEMILFLKNFKKYSDLPFEEMKQKKQALIQEEYQRETKLSKEDKILNYAESLYKD